MADGVSSFLRGIFSFLSARSAVEDRVAMYVIREHKRGRSLEDILDDAYLKNRLTPQQRDRLLDREDVIHAVGNDNVEETRRSLEAGKAP
ncbi:MAG TPA: hypothetical protein VE596_18730 [Gaiellaceae bacterium]|jgi:hypothetical protein|nr:hypothetical protein [Gaiellaceae bacterium]